jgi:hypothetical protein
MPGKEFVNQKAVLFADVIKKIYLLNGSNKPIKSKNSLEVK